MNEKDTKVPIYIAIIVALILVAAGGYFFLGGAPKIKPEKPAETPIATPKETPTVPPSAVPTATPPKLETIKCELCHKESEKIKAHINGGEFCINCHGSQVHNIHIGLGTVDLKCDACHGLPPNIKVPQVEKGEGPGHYSTCEQCHAPPPDSLKPSMGELVSIHLSRGKYCTNCHGPDIGVIHAASLANQSK